MAECNKICPFLELGTDDAATSGATIGCRHYHAGAAASTGDYVTHCVHAGVSGGQGNCGTQCDALCQISTKGCNGTNAVYTDFADCNKTCGFAFNSSGKYPTDTGVATLQCRLYHATVAVSTQDLSHCLHTSVSTNGVCGSKCENYCYVYGKTCTGKVVGVSKNDGADCLTHCAALNSTAGTVKDTSGNTVDCRAYHSVASFNDAQTHCYHASISGNDTCGLWCDVFCDMALKVCTAGNTVFADRTTCMTNCSAMSKGGKPGDQTGDSLQCRIYHLGVANSPGAGNLATHCPHAKTVSDGCTGAIPTGATSATTATTSATTSSTGTTTSNSFKIVLSFFAILGMLFI
jgi:hypothetical protein